MNQCPICGGALQAGYLHFNCMLLAFHPDKDFLIYYFFPTKKRLKKRNPDVVLLHGPYSFGVRGSKRLEGHLPSFHCESCKTIFLSYGADT